MADARNARRKRLDAAVKANHWDSSLCLIDGNDFKSCPHSYTENEQLFRAYRNAEILRKYL